MRTIFTVLAGLAISIFIVSCGSGSGDGSVSNLSGPNASAEAELATVSVLLTDASSDDYDEAIATITSIVLIGEHGQQTIFEGSVTVDLLKLRDFVELLAVNDTVEPDVINKVRLTLTSLVFIKRDDQGNVVKEDVATLVANGKLDLLPDEAFIILPGDKFYVSLDFDMDRSLKITETGNGKLIVRPVVFVHVGRLPGFKEGFARVFGEITRLAADFSALQICSDRLVAMPLDMDDEIDFPERCVKVVLDDRTGVFDPDGLPVRANTLMIGDPVTIVGFFGLEDEDGEGPTPKLLTLADSRLLDDDSDNDSDSDSDSDGGDTPPPALDFVLRAIVIEGGPMGTYQRIRGVLTSAVDAMNDTYGLLVAPDQGFDPDTMLLGQLYPTSRIFKFDGTEIRRQELAAGDGTLVDGIVIMSEPTDPMNPEPVEGDEVDTLRSAFMLVRPGGGTEPPEPEEETLVGKILTLDEMAQSMMVATPTGDRWVLADDALILFLVENDEGGLDVVKGTFDNLMAGVAVVAFGVEDIGGFFDADFIVSKGPMKPLPKP